MGYFLCPIFALLLCAMSKLEGKASFFFFSRISPPPGHNKKKKKLDGRNGHEHGGAGEDIDSNRK